MLDKPATPEDVITTLDWAVQLAVHLDLTGTNP